MKRPVKILLILLGAVVLAVLVIVANVSRSRSQVRGVSVSIRYGKIPHLVDEEAVADTVLAAIPTLLHQQVREVDCQAVAEAASKVRCLSEVSASVSVSGKVVVKARQRRPVARLFYGPREYYFDSEGILFPVSRTGHCDVLVTSGDFTEPLYIDSLNSQTQALVDVAVFLDQNEQYGPLIDQLYIESDGDIMMAPKLGDQIVELGPADNLSAKFSNLLAFYRNGMPRAGWRTYSKISLKFDGQVVCTKKEK